MSMFTVIEPKAAEWDVFVAQQPRAHVLQLSAWGTLKSQYGWQAERVALAHNGAICAGALLLFKALPMGLGTMAYLPMGRYIAYNADTGASSALWQAIDAVCAKHRAAWLKWEAGIFGVAQPTPDFAALGFAPSPQTIQPPRTVLIDINGTEDAILARMNQGTRRKIRQAQKNDIRYYEAQASDIAKFTALMQTTGARNEFGVHQADYYQRAYELFVPQHAALILAEHEGEPLAGVMVFAVGMSSWYLYGASSNTKRNLMAAYGAQWAAIQWARARGCTEYDMWGIPDEDEATLEAHFETRQEGLWGVYGFKRGWGGHVARAVGAWDKVYNPVLYQAYQWALRFRRFSSD
jgi:peptidoglycan pentaglycine glycine transferase (the first glycine)